MYANRPLFIYNSFIYKNKIRLHNFKLYIIYLIILIFINKLLFHLIIIYNIKIIYKVQILIKFKTNLI